MKKNKSTIMLNKDSENNWNISVLQSKYSLNSLSKALILKKKYKLINSDRYTIREIRDDVFELVIFHKRKKHFIKTFKKIYSQILIAEFGEISLRSNAVYLKDDYSRRGYYSSFFDSPKHVILDKSIMTIDIGFSQVKSSPLCKEIFFINEAHMFFSEERHSEIYMDLFRRVRKYGAGLSYINQIPITSSFRGTVEQKEILTKIKNAKSNHVQNYRKLDNFKIFRS